MQLDPPYTIGSPQSFFAKRVIPALCNQTTEQIDIELLEKSSLGQNADSLELLELQS